LFYLNYSILLRSNISWLRYRVKELANRCVVGVERVAGTSL
jgi:hypothetical protein